MLFRSIEQIRGNKFPSTNNEMELMAILEAINFINKNYNFGDEYIIYTDSNYSLQSVTKWCHNWINNGWKTSKKEPVSNKELIERIHYELIKKSYIDIKKIKGHANNKWNDIADDLATEASSEIKEKIIKEEIKNGK